MLPTKADAMKAVGKKRRELIVLQAKEKTSDGQGGSISVWVTKSTVLAKFKTPKYQTDVISGAVSSDMTMEIDVGYRTDVKKGWQVLYGERKFSVVHPPYHYEHETTILVCREVAK